ncbi:MAG TPA: cysteine-rich CWC family protein [Blastocatellia bacterium]|nr:cysteine-rich CWC family protein [Blastocatellia bacterium]
MKLPKLCHPLSIDRRESQTCEACGQSFVCGFSLKGCWCLQVKLSRATRERLKEKYRHCLCRSCLEKAEAGN